MKTKTTHTPGEGWRIGDAGHTVFGPRVTNALSPKVVASNLSRAEARLIVAAHDLFEAAKAQLCDNPRREDYMPPKARYKILRAAIRKAGGNS